jgi:predicted methyltransferase
VRDDMTLIEIWPAGGWWTEILAPYLAANGAYYAAEAQSDYARPARETMDARMAADPARYGKIRRAVFNADGKDIVPPGTADMVLVFRSLHNWMAQGTTEMNLATINRALKPGGVLGIEGHRGDPAQPQDPKAKSGYVREDAAIALIEAAGFKFAGKSEINANPRDTKDYPEGVWTLPPTYRLKDKDKDRYTAIGESDRFTLKFVKVR